VSDLPKRRRRFFSKIEIKTTDGHQDTLIGKLPRTQNLIVHIISQNITEIVGPSIREWKYFMKNVDEDFQDVEETDFMDEIYCSFSNSNKRESFIHLSHKY
jgi:hypothetical protein